MSAFTEKQHGIEDTLLKIVIKDSLLEVSILHSLVIYLFYVFSRENILGYCIISKLSGLVSDFG